MTTATLRREVEVDTKLADLWGQESKIRGYRDGTKLSLADSLGIKPEYVTRTRREVRQSAAELLALAETKLAEGSTSAMTRRRIEENAERWRNYTASIEAIREEAKPLEAIFAAAPWSRFFLVQNHGGHIHSSMHCSTCRPTTPFGWLPNLSGLTEEDAVTEHGPLLCSVCYPTAPVEWTLGNVKS